MTQENGNMNYEELINKCWKDFNFNKKEYLKRNDKNEK